MMSASHLKVEKWLNDYVSSSGRLTPKEAKFNSSLLRLTSDEIFKLVKATTDSYEQRTAVHWAAVKDHAWLVQSILSPLTLKERSELMVLPSYLHTTVLHLIGYNGSTSSLNCILNLIVTHKERCQFMNMLYINGNTPVLFAAWSGQTEVMRLMLKILTPAERFNVLKVQNVFGNTAMHDTAQQGHTETLKCIMDFISPTVQSQLLEIRNLDNQTPLEFAECREHHYTADYIRQCIEAAERHLIELPETGRDDAVQTGLLQRVQEIEELVTQLREDKQVQAAQLEVKEQQLEEKERQLHQLINVVPVQSEQIKQLINVVAVQSEQVKQLTNELLKAKEELANQKEDENTRFTELREQLARKETEIQEAYNKMHSLLKQQMQGVVHRKDTDTNNSVQVEVDQKKKAKIVSRCEKRVESTEHRMDSLKLPAAAVEETVMSENSCLEPVEATGTIEEGQLSITTTAMQVESESL